MIRGRSASTRRIGLFAKATIFWLFPRFSQAVVANTHLPVYRTYDDKSAPERVFNDLFLGNANGKGLLIRFRILPSFIRSWTALDCCFATEIWERI
jgi:hypothetical protein